MENELQHKIVTLTRDLILIPTSSNRPEDVVRGIQYIKNHIESGNIVIREFTDGGHPSMLALPEGVDHPEILLSGHIDVVPQAEESRFESRIEEGRIVGPGAGDMKGPLAVLLEIFIDLHAKYPGISLGLVITSDEEQGGYHGIKHLVEQNGLRAGEVLLPDSGFLNQITVEEKGILHLAVTARGEMCHASRPWEGDNALEKIVDYYNRIRDYFKILDGKSSHWRPTCVLSVISTDNEVTNRVPAHGECRLDVRFPPPYTGDEILKKLRELLDHGMGLETMVSSEPTRFEPDKNFIAITEELTGEPVQDYHAHGGSDARFFHGVGVPVLMTRPDVGNIHSEKEWVDIASLVLLYKIYHKYILQKLVK